jgi:hypothetical protein
VKQLIVFGCSFTSGYKLRDPADAWPYHVGKYMDREVENLSVAGASNLRILTSILSYFQNPINDRDITVMIMWSWPVRDTILDSNKFKWIDINPTNDGELIYNWLATHNNADLTYRSWLYVQHASLFLQSLGITHYNLSTNMELLTTKPAFINVPVKYLQILETVDQHGTVDSFHPNTQSHAEIAKSIIHYISETA